MTSKKWILLLSSLLLPWVGRADEELTDIINRWRSSTASVGQLQGRTVFDSDAIQADFAIMSGKSCQINVRRSVKLQTVFLDQTSGALIDWSGGRFEDLRYENPARVTAMFLFPFLPSGATDAFGTFTKYASVDDDTVDLHFKFKCSRSFDRCVVRLDKSKNYRISELSVFQSPRTAPRIRIVVEKWITLGDVQLPAQAVQLNKFAETRMFIDYATQSTSRLLALKPTKDELLRAKQLVENARGERVLERHDAEEIDGTIKRFPKLAYWVHDQLGLYLSESQRSRWLASKANYEYLDESIFRLKASRAASNDKATPPKGPVQLTTNQLRELHMQLSLKALTAAYRGGTAPDPIISGRLAPLLAREILSEDERGAIACFVKYGPSDQLRALLSDCSESVGSFYFQACVHRRQNHPNEAAKAFAALLAKQPSVPIFEDALSDALENEVKIDLLEQYIAAYPTKTQKYQPTYRQLLAETGRSPVVPTQRNQDLMTVAQVMARALAHISHKQWADAEKVLLYSTAPSKEQDDFTRASLDAARARVYFEQGRIRECEELCKYILQTKIPIGDELRKPYRAAGQVAALVYKATKSGVKLPQLTALAETPITKENFDAVLIVRAGFGLDLEIDSDIIGTIPGAEWNLFVDSLRRMSLPEFTQLWRRLTKARRDQ